MHSVPSIADLINYILFYIKKKWEIDVGTFVWKPQPVKTQPENLRAALEDLVYTYLSYHIIYILSERKKKIYIYIYFF